MSDRTCCDEVGEGIMTEAQRAIREEVYQHFNALPHDHMIMAERNREALETLGVW